MLLAKMARKNCRKSIPEARITLAVPLEEGACGNWHCGVVTAQRLESSPSAVDNNLRCWGMEHSEEAARAHHCADRRKAPGACERRPDGARTIYTLPW